MNVLFVPQKNNYPNVEPCLDIIGQGFPYVAAAVKKAGHEVFGCNINYDWCLPNSYDYLHNKISDSIRRIKPEVICVGGLSADFFFVRDVINIIREASDEIIIICGGGILTYDYEYIYSELKPDYGIIGEAEESIVLLLQNIKSRSFLSFIPGLIYSSGDGAVHVNDVVYATVSDLDSIPVPEYGIFNTEKYLDLLRQDNNNYFYTHTQEDPRVMPVSMARGCPFKCTFCCHEYGPKYRTRSVESVIDEIEYLYDAYAFNFLFIYDELATRGKMKDLCDAIVKFKDRKGIDFQWTCDFRVSDVRKDLLEKMSESGCSFIGYGLESASPTVLESMNKRISVDQIYSCMRINEETKVGFQGNFIFGDPAETKETIDETMQFYKEYCTDHLCHFGYVTPYPGSSLFHYCLDNHLVEDRYEFYTKIKSFGNKVFNMTSLNTAEFFNYIDNIINTYGRVSSHVNAEVVKSKRIRVSDDAAPRHKRKHLFLLEIKCPHCGGKNSYMQSLSIREKFAVQACSSCHKRFKVRVVVNKIFYIIININEKMLYVFSREGFGKVMRYIYGRIRF